MKQLNNILIAVIILALGYCLLLFVTFYSVDTYIDIHSGDIKVVRKVCKIKIKEEIEQTEFSKLVRKFTDVQKEPDWKYCYGNTRNIFMTRGHSDSWKWGEGPSLSRVFDVVIDCNNMDESKLNILVQGCLDDLEKGDFRNFVKRMNENIKGN
jgi:hypothetical protein